MRQRGEWSALIAALNEGTTAGGARDDTSESSAVDGWSEAEYQRAVLRCWARRPSPSQETLAIVDLRSLLHGKEERATTPPLAVTSSASQSLPFTSYLTSSWAMAQQLDLITVHASHASPPFLIVDLHALHSPLSIQLTLFLVLVFIRSSTRRLLTLEDAVDLVPSVLVLGAGRDQSSEAVRFLREVTAVECVTPFSPSSFHTPNAAAARSAIRGMEEQGTIEPALRPRVRQATSVWITRTAVIQWLSAGDGGVNDERWSRIQEEHEGNGR
jgi:hypothetical protein